MMFLELRLRRF